MANEYIELNLIPTGEKPVFHAAQYDVGRPIIIKLKNGEDDFTPTDLDIELQVRKVDNNIVTAVPVSVDGNVVTFLSTQQMTACSGTNLCEVELSDSSITIATLHFYLVVQRDVLAGGLTSQSEIYDLEEQIAAIVPEVIGDEYYTAEEVDEKIAEIPTFDPTNYYTKSQVYTKTETNGFLAQKANTSSLATVATSGSYNDLLNKPTIPDVSNYYTKSETYSQNEVNTLLGAKADTSSLSTVATTGDYDDLLNKPTIPDVSDYYTKSETYSQDEVDTLLSGKANTSDLPIWIKQTVGSTVSFAVPCTFFYYYADQWRAYVQFPFIAKNNNYSISLTSVQAENIGDITSKISVIAKYGACFEIETTRTMTALPNQFSVCVGTVNFTITFA